MPETTQLSLPLIEASQAQKHITHNEAILLLDATTQLSVKSRKTTTPPTSPKSGDRFLIPDTATGEWQNKRQQLAIYEVNIWRYLNVKTGWRCWVEDEAAFLLFDGSIWRTLQSSPLQGVENFGINATADLYNRLSVASSSVLFNHNGSDQRLTINKNETANTASVVFQDNFSGRAEFGLTGDDHFHMKVSADGTTWHNAIVINSTTGLVTLTPTSVDNNTLTVMPEKTIKGRISSGTGQPEDLTTSQLASLLSNFSSTSKGLVPPSGSSTMKFLRGDGLWSAPQIGDGNYGDVIISNNGTSWKVNTKETTEKINIWGRLLAAPFAMP